MDNQWRMKINIRKTEICLFTKQPEQAERTRPEVKLQEKKINYNPTPKLLGVVLDETLNFHNHISKVERKANRAMRTLRQIKYVENIDTNLYSYTRP